MEDLPLTGGDQLELVKPQINKMVDWGVFTPSGATARRSVHITPAGGLAESDRGE